MNTARFARTACAALLLAATSAGAQTGKIDQEAEMNAAIAAAKAVAKTGPAEIALGKQASLKLPAGYAFIPQPQANGLMKAMGNGEDASRLGIIVPPDSNSFVVPRYIDAGYIKDDEAADWKADELLSSIREGTEEGNKERQARGMPEMEIVGWSQKPVYDKASHRLVWAIESKDKGASNEEHGANYNTYVLGREGYLSMNLVSGFDSLEANKPFAQALLARTSFNPGKTYADFNASTDKVAEYGIAALVTGVAAKKLGLFAVIGAFALKFAKIIAIAAFGLLAAIGKFFRRGKA
ncbi:DUF2167 domain-containing protein [Massilia sp. Dwa41.01b]|uniref:DUF2167 domain-containing protein n=1 Tax=unclassified Massilia TaxID=2609279 RepID=UPI00160008DC|nr:MULTISPECIES: DUF2167 domain-containing protein [unclassified Massilia]QNA87404.1 DUF2167 domain-containing protein [Massilia sp. Dwa41.01b]QNA98310.1 DUF2167 domain-containing protein [Massilia sp. Se16.2.3]